MIYNIFPIRCRLKNGKVVSLSLSCSADLVWGRGAALTAEKLIFLYGDMSYGNLTDARVLQYLGAPVMFGVEMPLFCHFSLQMWKIRRLHWLCSINKRCHSHRLERDWKEGQFQNPKPCTAWKLAPKFKQNTAHLNLGLKSSMPPTSNRTCLT